MITITNIEIKTTTTGKEYKLLTLNTNEKVAMWSEDPDYQTVTVGQLNRTTVKNGQYTNLADKNAPTTSEEAQGLFKKTDTELEKKVDIIYWLLRKVADKVLEDPTIITQDGLDYPEENIEPSQIPF